MKTETFPYTFFHGKIVKTEEAVVPVSTNALQYGTGIFAGIRGYYSTKHKYLSIFRIEDHYKRFLSSTKILGCAFPYTVEELQKITIELVKKNKPKVNTYFRPFAYVGHTNIGPNLANTSLDFALYMLAMDDYLPVNKGLSVMVTSWRRVNDNAIPARGKISGAYVNSALAKKESQDYGFDDAIFLNEEGKVSEGSAANLFLVRNGVLVTSTVSDNILEGITRRSLMHVAQDLGIPVEVRNIDRSELYVCDEAFFAGTGVQVAWIGQIDKRTVGNGKRGPITGRLQETYFSIVRGEDDKYINWCTKVPII